MTEALNWARAAAGLDLVPANDHTQNKAMELWVRLGAGRVELE
jgi:hypothetical protein